MNDYYNCKVAYEEWLFLNWVYHVDAMMIQNCVINP